MSTKLCWYIGPLLLLLPFLAAKAQSPTVMKIHSGWQFREVGKTDWYNATVPGCVHTDLLANKLIDDPFYRDNEKKQQWIGKTDWEYRTSFRVAAQTVERENVELVFEGLDTYAGVYLNEQLVLKADNMFRTWRVNAKSTLKPGENTLRIIFRSPINEILPVMAKLNYQLPAPNDQGEKTSPYTRKAPYHYGWDWGPRFVTSGVWRPVSIEAWDHARVEDLQVVIKKISPDVAELTANVEIEAGTNGVATVVLENVTDKVSAGKQQIKIFHGVLQEVRAKYDPSRPYWPSSPHGGLDDDPESLRSGDVHFWRVWHASEPFSDYEKQTPRFMSEYGFQSFQNSETVKSYTVPSDRDIESPIMLAHQRHPRGNQLMREYMLRDYAQPKDFESFLYVSQVLQAEGIRIGAEHLRRIMPHNMGSLYWQINDCWPVASWSSIDYYGRWKALEYYARRFYSDLFISPTVQNGYLKVFVVSDQPKAVPAKIRVTLMNFDGATLKSFVRDVNVTPLTSRSYFDLRVPELLDGTDEKNVVVFCELLVNEKTVSSHDYFFAPFKELKFSKPGITSEVVRTRSGFSIKISSDKFAKAVYLAVPEHDGFFSDNYFNFAPGREMTLEFRSRVALSLTELQERLQIRSVFDAFQ